MLTESSNHSSPVNMCLMFLETVAIVIGLVLFNVGSGMMNWSIVTGCEGVPLELTCW